MDQKENRSRSVVSKEQRSINEDRNMRTDTMRRSLHDMEEFKKKKMEQSAPFFRSTRVQTCSHVMMKNGIAVAVAYPLEKTGWKNPTSYANTKRSAEIESWASNTYKERAYLHAGMTKKPLEPYHPNSFRSRLPQPTVIMPYKNSSQIVIGDRSSDDKRLFRTMNQLKQIPPKLENAVTNGGILAAQTKWIHKQQAK